MSCHLPLCFSSPQLLLSVRILHRGMMDAERAALLIKRLLSRSQVPTIAGGGLLTVFVMSALPGPTMPPCGLHALLTHLTTLSSCCILSRTAGVWDLSSPIAILETIVRIVATGLCHHLPLHHHLRCHYHLRRHCHKHQVALVLHSAPIHAYTPSTSYATMAA
jgi:hypothetical protein